MAGLADRLSMTVQQAGPPLWPCIAHLGIGHARISGNVYDLVKTPGVYTFAWLDALVDALNAMGIMPHVCLTYAPPWQVERNTPPNVPEWQQFCTAFAQHFPAERVPSVALWNEPNVRGMFDGDVDEYVNRVVRPAVEIFRRVSPHTTMCAPDLSTEGEWRPWLKRFLELAGEYIDIITVHAYDPDPARVWSLLTEPQPYPSRPRWWPGSWPWPIPFRIPGVKQVITQCGYAHKPLWLNETGYQGDEGLQAHYVEVLVDKLARDSSVAGLGFFQLMTEHGHQWGFFREDRSAKPAAEALRRVANVIPLV